MAEKTSTTTKTGLRPLEVGVGAAAAVITAFASSYLGTAGTLTGAALASIVGTISTSVLRTSAQRTNESLARTTSRLRHTVAGPEWRRGSTAVDPGVAAVDQDELARLTAPPAGPDPAGTGSFRTGPAGAGSEPADERAAPTAARLFPGRRPAWAVLIAGVVAAFAVALVAITGIESAFGKPLAALIGNEQGGGTTIGRTVGSESATTTDKQVTPAPSPTASEEPSPSESPSPAGATSPTSEPSTSVTPPPTAGPSVTNPAPATAAPTS
jgi:hypothetical protein